MFSLEAMCVATKRLRIDSTIVKRLQAYLAYVENKELFNTTIYPMGDGMSVSVWKGHNK